MRVSVGIPAHNEEKNIKNVLQGVVTQKETGFSITEILVYLDGCTDNTRLEAASVTDSRIVILEDGFRVGKTERLNQMFEKFSGDVLVMLDGDMKISDDLVFSHLLKPFAENSDVVLVGGNSRPFPPESFIQRAVNCTFNVFYQSRLLFKGGNNVFGCTGSILAISKAFAKATQFPKIFNEDTYLYLKCVEEKKLFRYVDDAIIYYKLPTTLSDYLKQLFRSEPSAVNVELEKYFGPQVFREFNRPKFLYSKLILKELLKTPLELLFIVFINVLAKPLYSIVSKKYKLEWFTAKSTHV